MNHRSPKALAVMAALILAILVLGICFLFQLHYLSHVSIGFSIGLSIFTFLAGYLIFNYIMGRMINDRIKLIYKTIHQLKITHKKNFSIDMNEDVLSNMNKEVAEWAEEKRKEIEALKSQENYRREFIGNVSHELKTPIFNIQGYILTLLEGGLKDSTINIKYLEKAAKSTERLTQIVEDLDEISGFEAGRLELFIQKINIIELANEVMDSFEMKAKEFNVALTFRKEYENAIWVMADKKRIRQVFVNLIDNALKYGKEKGKIEIRFYDLDENLLVEVADDGLGIANKHLPRLFERFYRVDASRSRDKGGTGLGLAIVKHIIEAHNQTINVRSTLNVGSTFGFTLKKGDY